MQAIDIGLQVANPAASAFSMCGLLPFEGRLSAQAVCDSAAAAQGAVSSGLIIAACEDFKDWQYTIACRKHPQTAWLRNGRKLTGWPGCDRASRL